MYAVIESGGKQHKVVEGEVLKLEKIDAEAGETVSFDKVMMIGSDEKVTVGQPYVDAGSVSAEVVTHGRHDKINIIKMKRRKHYRRQAGHRQWYTEVRIKEIVGDRKSTRLNFQSHSDLVCRLLLEKKNNTPPPPTPLP